MVNKQYTPAVTVANQETVLENDIDKLNHLLEMEQNSVKGYERALETADNPTLQRQFLDMRDGHMQRVAKISNMITELHGEPTQGGTLAGALHRHWLDLKQAIASNDEAAIVEASAFGERNLDDAYEDMIVNGKLETQSIQDSVMRMHEEVHAAMSRMNDLVEVYRN